MRYQSVPLRSDDESYWWEQGPLLPHLSVDGPVRVNTGLLDQLGHPIYRIPNPIGFGRMEEWG